MMRPAIAVLVASLLAPAAARADLPPTGVKVIETTIRVDGELPAGKALVLSNTREGGDPIPVGVAVAFSAVRVGDSLMELFLVDAAAIPRIDELRHQRDETSIRAMLRRGAACGSRFDSSPVVAPESPAVERRYNFTVEANDDRCVARMLSVELIDAAKREIGPDPAAKIVPAPEPLPAASPAASPPADGAAPEQARGLCRVGEPAAPSGLLALALLTRRRTRRP